MNLTQTHSTLFRKAIAAAMALAVIASGLALLRTASAANNVINFYSAAAPASVAQNDQPQIGPGVPQVGSNAAKSGVSNTKAGSALFFHKYTSDSANPSGVNTIITLTNTNPRDAVTARLFFVRDCTVINQFANLAANQTRTFLASDVDSGKTGYIVAVAVNSQGIPSQFNWLVGSASLRDAQGHEASYNAVGVAKRSSGPVASVVGTAAEMKFNNVEYDSLPQLTAIDNIQSQAAGGVRTDLFVYSPRSDLSGAGAQPARITATAYEQSGVAHPAVVETACGLNSAVSDIWTQPPVNSYITPTRPGWGSFAASTTDNVPLPVFALSLSDNVSSQAVGALRNARHTQVLTRLDSFSIKLPIAAPPTPLGDPFTTNQPNAPGDSLGASEMKAGSALFYHRYATGTYGQSRINITNTHPTQSIRIRLFFTGLLDQTLTKDTFISLAANQTRTIDPNEFAPNQKGWVFAIAIDNRAIPTNFNFLIGSGQVSDQQSGGATGYNALAIAKNSPGSLSRNSDATTADIIFNDGQYDRLPSTVAIAALPSQADNTTTVLYARTPASLLDPVNTRGAVTATAYDDTPAPFTATIPGIEAKIGTVRSSLQGPPISNTILQGRPGWLKLLLSTPILPLTINTATAPFAAAVGNPTWTGGFNGGSTFYILASTDSSVLRALAIDPNNQPPVADFAPIDALAESRALNGTIFRLDGRASSDPNAGDTLTYRWTDNDRLITTAPVSDFRLGVGSHFIRLVVTDSAGVASEQKTTLVEVRDTTAPIMSGVPTNITKVTGNSAGIALTFPPPVAFDIVDGFLNVTASKASGSIFPIGKTTVTFKATDFSGNQATATMEVNVIKDVATLPTQGGVARNKVPYMNSINDQYVIPGKTRRYLIEAKDLDNDPITFTLQGAPVFAKLDQVDPNGRRAMLLITPQQGDTVVTNNVRVTISDGKGGTFTTLPFRIILSDVANDENGSGQGPNPNPDPDPGNNTPPVAVAAALPASIPANSKLGASVRLDGSQSSDPNGDTLSYSWRDNGAEIATTAIADVFLTIGQHSLTLTVSDGRGGTNTTSAQAVEVTPRPFSVKGISPARLRVFNQNILTITGTGFTPGMQVRFDCTSFCKAGSKITVTITSIEEDTIILNARTMQDTPIGDRDLYVTAPNGQTIKLTRSNFVAP